MVRPSISAAIVVHERDFSVSGEWYSCDTYYFDLSLSGRPASARGYFAEMGGGYRPIGDLLFIPAGYHYHGKGGPGHQQCMFVEIHSQDGFEDEYDVSRVISSALLESMNLPADRLRSLLMQIRDEIREPGFASGLLIEGLGVTLLAETIRLLQRLNAHGARKGGLSPWRMRVIEHRVQEGENLPTLAELARLCGLSRRQLMRAFREETGRTVGSYVQDLTLQRARNLLRDTNLPIREIAVQVGFTDATAFSTAFRRATGESPRNFRQAGT